MQFRSVADRILKRARAALERLWERGRSAHSALLEKSQWYQTLVAAGRDFRDKKMVYYAGHFTYNAFLAMLALTIAVSSVLGFVLQAYPDIRRQFIDVARDSMPVFGTAPSGTAEALIDYRNFIGVIGLLGLLWTGTKMFSALEHGFAVTWGTERRSYARGKLLGMALISIVGVIFVTAVTVQFAFTAVWGWLVGKDGWPYDVGVFAFKPLLSLALSFALFATVYRLVPNVKLTFRRIAVGALAAAFMFLAIQYLLGFYFSNVSKIPSVYGSLATAVVLIIWLHVLGLIIFYGAELVRVTGEGKLPPGPIVEGEEAQ